MHIPIMHPDLYIDFILSILSAPIFWATIVAIAADKAIKGKKDKESTRIETAIEADADSP